MNELTASLKVALANVYVMYFKAHTYHWNVEGPKFHDLHGFFGDIYEDVYGSIDGIAENIRKLDDYAPFSLDNLFTYKTLSEDNAVPSNWSGMVNNLYIANDQVLQALNKAFDVATTAKEQGLADYISGRIDTHKKHRWQFLALLKDGK